MAGPRGDSLGPVAPPTIGIAGGHGGMGSLFARLLGAAGATVLLSDRDTPLRNVDLAARCDLTFVAVPLRATPGVLAELAPCIRPEAALCSLGSLMEPAATALETCPGEAFLLHPLFGPAHKRLHGATLALAVLRGGRWHKWLLSWLRTAGAGVVMTTPTEHDRTMATAQALLHGSYAALTPQLAGALGQRDPLAWASPTLRLQLGLMSRILHQDARLYGDLLALNHYTPEAIDALTARLEELRAAVREGPDAVAAFFEEARKTLGASGPLLAVEGNRALDEA